MKLFKIIAIFMVVLIVLLTALSCSGNSSSNTPGETTQASDDDSPAVKEVKDFFNSYYEELNNKNFEIIKSVYSEGEEDLQAKVDNFTFMSSLFDVTYELRLVQALYLDNGDISASVSTVLTSKNIETGEITVMLEPSTYLLSKSSGTLKIVSYAFGESTVLEINE